MKNRGSSRGGKKAQKGKKTIPTMAFFKNFKSLVPVVGFPPWTGDEAMTIKAAAKPVFEDTPVTQVMTEKYATLLRVNQIFGEGSVLDDADVQLSFANPEVSAAFSSALFLCLAKGPQFFDSGTFEVFPQEANPSGKYCMKVYENGLPVRLFFDDRIGCSGDPPECAFLRHSDRRIVFPTLAHKAFLRFMRFENFNCLDVVHAFTGFVPYDIPLDWVNLQSWFGRPDSIVALHIREQRNEGLGSDRLFHILDVVDLDQHRKFVKLQCPGAQWRGRFSGFEEDTRHWTNQIRVILEIDPETAATAGYFWMIYEDLVENFDCIVVFAPPSSFTSNIKSTHAWTPKEGPFYIPPPPRLLKCSGVGRIQICAAPLLTTAPTNELKIMLRPFNWATHETPPANEIIASSWKITTLEVTKHEEMFEMETFSKGGYVMQILGIDTHVEFEPYNQVTSVTSVDGDLPFYVSLEENASSIFSQRFELVGKVVFNLDQPGNVAFALSVTNEVQKPYMTCIIFNNDLSDATASINLRSGSAALTPNKYGYTLLVFGLYTEAIMSVQPAELVGRWRLSLFSDSPLSDVVDAIHSNYAEIEGDCDEMDETHEFSSTVITGGGDAVIVLETDRPLSLTLIATEDDVEVSCVRGVGFVILPFCRVPGDKDTTRFVIRGISSEMVIGFSWKLRIFSIAPLNCKEDTAPAEKTAAAIAAWEKKRTVTTTKPTPAGKRSETKSRTSNDSGGPLGPAEIDDTMLETVSGDGTILAEDQIASLLQTPTESAEPQSIANLEVTSIADPGEELAAQFDELSTQINDQWDQFEQKRSQISKLFTPTPPKADEK